MPEMTCQNVVNMVVEIPKHTHAKMETAIKTPHNPIVQDTKNGKLRFLKNVFPMYGYPFNYGMIPQVIILGQGFWYVIFFKFFQKNSNIYNLKVKF